VTVAAFVLGLVGTVLAAGSLVWTGWQHMRRQPPKLVPVVAFQGVGNLSVVPATADAADLITAAIAAENPIHVGVEVLNRDRLPLHVSGWFWGHHPTGHSVHPPETIGQSLPCDIGPGATATFLSAPSVFAKSPGSDESPSRFYPYVISNGRAFKAKPFAAQIAAIFAKADHGDRVDQHD
jgi:hypothetical protein